MATTYKVRYKNHCTPQEQIASGGRYYLDSDCGRKLTGDTDALADEATATGSLLTDLPVSDSAVSIGNSKDFIYIKNTGSNDVFLSITTDATAKYVIVLSTGEAFASCIDTLATVRYKCASGETSTIERYAVT